MVPTTNIILLFYRKITVSHSHLNTKGYSTCYIWSKTDSVSFNKFRITQQRTLGTGFPLDFVLFISLCYRYQDQYSCVCKYNYTKIDILTLKMNFLSRFSREHFNSGCGGWFHMIYLYYSITCTWYTLHTHIGPRSWSRASYQSILSCRIDTSS